jgi:4-amino-4-deoxy-L-arabinose transferase-like glycosyltransferase
MSWPQRHAVFVVAVFGFLLLSLGNWMFPLIDRDEPRFAEASREMARRNDFVIPYFNGSYRFDKPPLIYWCEVASYKIFGESETAARLPSVVFAVATALVLVSWGKRSGNARAGFFAGLIFLTCLQVLIHGRLAVADMPMVFFFTVAVWSAWEMTRSLAADYWWWVFYLSLALGFLAKGPEAWLPFAGLWIVAWRRRAVLEVTPNKTILGIVLTLALVALWGAPALIRTHSQFFAIGIGRHVFYRSFDVMEGHGLRGGLGYVAALPFFFVAFFASFFPWSIWVPGALRRRGSNHLETFLLIQAAVVFAVFTIIATKLPHYTLPAFPLLALWLGFRLDPRRISSGVAIASALTIIALFPLHWLDQHLLSNNLWRQAAPFIGPETRVASVEYGEPSLVWEFRRVSTNDVAFLSLQQAAAFSRGPGPSCLILPTKDLESLHLKLPDNAVTLHARGLTTASFRSWDMTAIIQP